MRFLHPELAWWFLGALAVVGLLRWWLHRGFASTTTVRWLPRRHYRASWLRRLPIALLVLSLGLIACALMDPVLPYSEGEVTSRGLDIVIALDLSSSMQEEMEPPPFPGTKPAAVLTSVPPRPRRPGKTRLEATKDAIREFVRLRRDDRLALVVFSDNAYVVSPLTFDRDYLLHYIDLVDDQILRGEGMTAIGDGLALANFLLARQSHGMERRNQVIVLFTDGENNKGRDPLESLTESNAANIRVHFVGVDLEDEVRNKPQVQQLLQAVRRFGGRYFNANTIRDLDVASRTIDSIEKGVLVSKAYLRDTPVYQWFAVPALLCLVAAGVLRAIPFFVDQT
ncbi:MAG TPA: VWA domain-containing protein [Vicinamibacterales bacterium]|jgi:Ca-activated chloride channel family protein|nr:VWA domain-containing protein [Vicinamibacterales bacterium]